VNFVGNGVLCIVVQVLQNLHGVLLQLLHVQGGRALSTHLAAAAAAAAAAVRWKKRLLQLRCSYKCFTIQFCRVHSHLSITDKQPASD
jgi:hypothetical protein